MAESQDAQTASTCFGISQSSYLHRKLHTRLAYVSLDSSPLGRLFQGRVLAFIDLFELSFQEVGLLAARKESKQLIASFLVSQRLLSRLEQA